MYGEVYWILIGVIISNRISINIRWSLQPKDLFCSGPDKPLMYPLSLSKNYHIAMPTSQLIFFISNFILYMLLCHVSNCLLTTNIQHSISLNGLGMARFVIAWMKIIWPLPIKGWHASQPCKARITKNYITWIRINSWIQSYVINAATKFWWHCY